MNFSFNFLRLDLCKINSVEDAKKILLDNNILESDIKSEKLFLSKEFHQALFFDPTTLYLVAYIKKGEKDIIFVPEFTDFMNNLKSIKNSDKNISLDSILDKISKSGVSSLNKKEVIFLDKSSKK